MSQPVKLSDSLVVDARVAGEITERSIAGQVEFWARIGRSVELMLQGQQVLQLLHSGAAQPLSACLEGVDTASGRARVAAYLQSQPYPHYRPLAGQPGLLERIEEDGSRCVGRFIHRRFEIVRASAQNGSANER